MSQASSKQKYTQLKEWLLTVKSLKKSPPKSKYPKKR